MEELIRIGRVAGPGNVDGGSRALGSVAAVTAGSRRNRAVIIARRAHPGDAWILMAVDTITSAVFRVIKATGRYCHRAPRKVTADAGCRCRDVGETSATPVRLRGALYSVTALAIAEAGNSVIKCGRAHQSCRPVAGMTITTNGRSRAVREGSTGPVSLRDALGQMAADTITRATIGVIKRRCSGRARGADTQVTVDATGGRRAMAEAGATPIRLCCTRDKVTALAIARSGNGVIEWRCANRPCWPGARVATGAVFRSG